MSLHRVQVELTGWAGAPGLNTFHCDSGSIDLPPSDLANFVTELEAMYTAIKGFLVPGLTARLLPEAPVIDVETGQIERGETVTPWTVTAESGGTSSLSRATMVKAHYTTGEWLDGRQLRGGVYLGPVDQQALDTDGSIPSGVRDLVTSSHNGLLTGSDRARLAVYRRPRKASGTKPARPGAFAQVTAVAAMSVPAVLRSRRD